MGYKMMKPRYGRMAIYILLLGGVALLMGGLRSCRQKALPALEQGGSQGDTIDAGIIYGPLSYYLYDDTLGGINYDMLRQMGRALDRPVRFWPVVNIEEGLQRLSQGRFAILASLPSDRQLKKHFIPTSSIYLDRLVLVQLPQADGTLRATSALHLAGDTVHIPESSPAAERLLNLSQEIGEHVEVKEEKGLSEEYLCIKVAKGEIRYAVVGEKTALAMQERYPQLNIDNPMSFTQFQVWVLNRRDTTLRHDIDTWLDSYEGSEGYRKMLERYGAFGAGASRKSQE